MRWLLFGILFLLQVAALMPSTRDTLNWIYPVGGTCLLLGLISVNWRIALKNLLLVTLPMGVIICVMYIGLIQNNHGFAKDIWRNINTALLLWGISQVGTVPFFIVGFLLRQTANWIQIKRYRRQ